MSGLGGLEAGVRKWGGLACEGKNQKPYGIGVGWICGGRARVGHG